MPYTARPDLYDLEYAQKDYAAESAALVQLIRARNPDARTLLDVACGTGKHLDHLRQEFDVMGVDLDEGLLAVARERLPGVPLEQGDMRTLDLGRRFDAVTCLFSAIGFLGGVDELEAAARSLAAHLEPGGVLLVEPWLTPDVWLPSTPHVLAEKAPGVALARVTLSGLRDERISTTEMHYVVATPDGFHEFVEHHELYLFTADEMRAAFESAGLEVEHDPDGLIGRGLWIATRPAPTP
ncbi:MAG TPA: class I SAM-dependent methyltransferase [Gaiellaceae bacterium]|nr:class I SAM-dependent methyltransferase [Gaiellaceae bacterium]